MLNLKKMRFVWKNDTPEKKEVVSAKMQKGLSFDEYVQAYEKLDPRERQQFLDKTVEWGRDFSHLAVQKFRNADLSQKEMEASPDKRNILLSSLYIQRVPGKSDTFTADFKNDYTAEYKAIGWGHVFPWTADEISVSNQNGEVICERAVHRVDPEGREGFFEAEGLAHQPPDFNYVYMYTGYTAKILKTISSEEAAAKRKKNWDEFLQNKRGQRHREILKETAIKGKTPQQVIDAQLLGMQEQVAEASSPLESLSTLELRAMIVEAAQNAAAKPQSFKKDFQSLKELEGGNKGCAWVAYKILNKAGVLNQRLMNVDDVMAALKARGWRESKEKPEPGDVVAYTRLPAKKVIQDDGSEAWRTGHKHIGIVTGPNTVIDNRGPSGPGQRPLFRPGRGIEAVLKPPRSVGEEETVSRKAPQEKMPPRVKGAEVLNDPEFRKKLEAVADRVGVSPDDLIQVMRKESGVNPQAINPISAATGLIQFMPKTARNLGTTVEALYRMSAVEQLDYVEKFFQPHIGKLHNYPDLYLAVFYPLALSKPRNFIFGSEKSMKHAQKVAQQNPAISKYSHRPDKLIDRDTFERYALGGVTTPSQKPPQKIQKRRTEPSKRPSQEIQDDTSTDDLIS